MKNSLAAILAILGTVIGSGFISGKEITVFFSRFGIYSFPCIFLSFFIFWGLFYLILTKGEFALKKLKHSKLSFVINLIICTIFSSAMFAGTNNLLKFDNIFINFLIFSIVLLICFIIYKKGLKFLNKINYFLIPFMIIVLFALLISNLSFKGLTIPQTSYGGLSFFYAMLYSLLNTSNGCVLIAKLSSSLTKRQKARVSFLSALVLMLILLFANVVLLRVPFDEDMPMLSVLSGWQSVVMMVIIFIGCVTTLFSLMFTSSFSMRGLCNNEFLIFLISLIAPLACSLLGFNFIVTYLYPIASILGAVLLVDLFFIPFFKRADDKIHPSGKYTK